MLRLLYTSEITPFASAFLASTIEDILYESVQRNQRDNITGFLLCDGEFFAQVLEGPPDELRDCYARISRDDRHHKLELRLYDEIAHPQFERWSMCGITLSPKDDALLHPADIGFDIRRIPAEALLQHLFGIAARHADELDELHEGLLAGYETLARPVGR